MSETINNNISAGGGNKNILSITIKDKNVLYATYMSFIKPDGGLFIPTKKGFQVADKLSILLTLPEDSEKYEVIGRVSWITPLGVHGARAPGIGVQFEGPTSESINARIKQILSLELLEGTTRPTYTM